MQNIAVYIYYSTYIADYLENCHKGIPKGIQPEGMYEITGVRKYFSDLSHP